MISEQEWIQFIDHCFYGNTTEVKKALNNNILGNINYQYFCNLQNLFVFHRGRKWLLVKSKFEKKQGS